MTLETSKCSDKMHFQRDGMWYRVETHRVKYILKKLLEAMLCLFSQRLMMEIKPDENLYYIKQGTHKNENDLNYSA